MAVLRVTNFGGLKPRASARALPADAAQTAHNLQANTREFRPLATDTQVIANTGLTNPLTIFRLQRNSDGSLNTDFTDLTKWKVYAGRRSFVKAQVNDDTTDRHYYSFDDGTAAPRVLDATGNDRQLGVPAPTTAPTVSVNETDEFTSEDRATGLQAALALAIKAVQDSASVVWRGAADPGTGTTGYLNRTTANGFATADPSQQVRVYRLAASGGAISDSYTALDDSAFNWVFDPSLAAIVGDSTAGTPAWAGTAGTPHICIPYSAYGLTYSINTSTLTTALAAITMPGKTDGTKLFTTDQVAEIVGEISDYADPAGPTIQPKIQALAAKVTELRTLLDGGGRNSVVAQTTAFYSKADVVAAIDDAIDSWANFVFNKADDIARSSLGADYLIGAQP